MARIAFLAFYDEYCEGIRYLSACLKAQGHEVQILIVRALSQINTGESADDGGYHVPPCHVSGREIELAVDWIRRFDPLLVGITLTSNFTGLAQRFTEEIRKVCGATIAWGGIDATINPDVAIESADVVCVGEGEYATLEMVERLEKGQSPAGIQNLWVRVNGHVEKREQRPTIQNLEELPFSDWERETQHFITEGQFYPESARAPHFRLHHVQLFQTSRGCPYQCTYCCHSELREVLPKGKYVRRRSVDHVIAELQQRIRLYPSLEVAEFYDDVFIMDRRYMREFAEKYGSAIGLPFWCYAYPHNNDPEILGALRDAGMRSVTFGIQSASPRILNEVFKRPTRDGEILRTARILREQNIHYVVDLIGSNPFETDEDRRYTLETLVSLARPYLLHPVNPLSLYRNYPIVDQAREAGIPLEKSPGCNKYMAPRRPEYDFWDALYTLAQFEHLPGETVLGLSRDEHLRQHPELLKAMAEAQCQAVFMDGDIYKRKSQRIAELESELAAIRGSRFFQVFERYRGLKATARRALTN